MILQVRQNAAHIHLVLNTYVIMQYSITVRARGAMHEVFAEELQKNVANISAGNCNTGARQRKSSKHTKRSKPVGTSPAKLSTKHQPACEISKHLWSHSMKQTTLSTELRAPTQETEENGGS